MHLETSGSVSTGEPQPSPSHEPSGPAVWPVPRLDAEGQTQAQPPGFRTGPVWTAQGRMWPRHFAAPDGQAPWFAAFDTPVFVDNGVA